MSKPIYPRRNKKRVINLSKNFKRNTVILIEIILISVLLQVSIALDRANKELEYEKNRATDAIIQTSYLKESNNEKLIKITKLEDDLREKEEILKLIEEKAKKKEEENRTLKEEVNKYKTRERKVSNVSRGKTFSVPNSSSHFKSYMDLKLITSKTSSQYKFIQKHRNEGSLYCDQDGFYKIGDCYLVALGSAYGSIGDMFELSMSSGDKIKVVKSDVKADAHTDPTNSYHISDGSVVEFLVNTSSMNSQIRRDGGPHNMIGFRGKVNSITKLN